MLQNHGWATVSSFMGEHEARQITCAVNLEAQKENRGWKTGLIPVPGVSIQRTYEKVRRTTSRHLRHSTTPSYVERARVVRATRYASQFTRHTKHLQRG